MINLLTALTTTGFILQKSDIFCQAFPVTTWQPSTTSAMTVFRKKRRSSMSALYMRAKDEHGDFFDVEAARKKLEALVTDSGALLENPRIHGSEEQKPRLVSNSVSLPNNISPLPERPILDVMLPVRGPLTTIERERRLTEIQLLSTLDKGDHTLGDIWDLWFSERGPQAAALLREADDLMNQGPEGFETAERILRALVEEHGVYFSEPLNRLATIYYLQGRMEQALTLNKMVLAVKPWHFGALSHIVMVYAAIGDNQSARQWAAFRLPTFEPEKSNRRRVRWVERAVTEAKMLLNVREDTIVRAFGSPDNDWVLIQNKMSDMGECDDDSWQ